MRARPAPPTSAGWTFSGTGSAATGGMVKLVSRTFVSLSAARGARRRQLDEERSKKERSAHYMKCPKCGKGHLTERKSRYGKPFYGCANWSKTKCDFVSWDKPFAEVCPPRSFDWWCPPRTGIYTGSSGAALPALPLTDTQPTPCGMGGPPH